MCLRFRKHPTQRRLGATKRGTGVYPPATSEWGGTGQSIQQEPQYMLAHRETKSPRTVENAQCPSTPVSHNPARLLPVAAPHLTACPRAHRATLVSSSFRVKSTQNRSSEMRKGTTRHFGTHVRQKQILEKHPRFRQREQSKDNARTPPTPPPLTLSLPPTHTSWFKHKTRNFVSHECRMH